ncbi:MAG: L-2-amino-thiazoline-4-carboxylic acid hydrolase [Proteobacteria bacterium]|nr:L-2-amino-thiazoline-4-carboxylic acid hydrolase [Pseudomonadota bacterium]
MAKDAVRKSFTPTHHAMLYAWMSRAVVQRIGLEKGEAVMREGTRLYGRQRGKRMALRAGKFGHPTTMVNYLAYGEWEAEKDEMEQKIAEKTPHAKVHVSKCPWHTAWQKNDLMEYGRFFCLEVDQALVHGFNPDLVLEINGTQTAGQDHCEFVFREAELTVKNMASLGYKKTVKPGRKALMPWDYHTGHLYKTIGQCVIEKLGETGREAVDQALDEFENAYGKEAAEIVASHLETDFDRLPD